MQSQLLVGEPVPIAVQCTAIQVEVAAGRGRIGAAGVRGERLGGLAATAEDYNRRIAAWNPAGMA